MIRTQIYLSEAEKQALEKICRQTGKSQSSLIRQAIDNLISRHEPQDRRQLLQQARGLWQDRTDLPDFSQLRREMDRFRQTEER
jgi:predicted transcriptional regulator